MTDGRSLGVSSTTLQKDRKTGLASSSTISSSRVFFGRPRRLIWCWRSAASTDRSASVYSLSVSPSKYFFSGTLISCCDARGGGLNVSSPPPAQLESYHTRARSARTDPNASRCASLRGDKIPKLAPPSQALAKRSTTNSESLSSEALMARMSSRRDARGCSTWREEPVRTLFLARVLWCMMVAKSRTTRQTSTWRRWSTSAIRRPRATWAT